MYRSFFHTGLIVRILSLSIFVFFHVSVLGQDYDTTTLEYSDIDVPPAMESTDTAYNFDTPHALERLPVAQRRISDSALNKLRSDDAFWYANTKPNRKEEKLGEPFVQKLAQQEWFKTLLWVIILGSFAFILIWFLAVSNTWLFRKKPVTTAGNEEELSVENIFALDYEKEIGKAADAKNYRLAIRLMYLQVLKTLSDKNIITYKQDKTNSDYVQQLWNTRYYIEFFRLTRHFEYTWYGQFSVTEPAFELLKNDFATFKKQL